MISEKTITICGKEVRLRYCAGAEIGYENISGKSSEIFAPIVTERDADGKPTKINPPAATTDDYLKLALSAIVAAYGRNDEDAPIAFKDIIYDATPKEVMELLNTVVVLRQEWYAIPNVVPVSETDEKPDDSKNVQRPARRSKRS